ncbi:MAG: diadenylate cyclase CdaA [Bacteroidales bacterium]|nr:diadenylate cyclase CdaA [Bacteroidales bacterium]MDZ4204102.1 diadenylate cyclase CdaA [Bacteroidales bacterium]
MIDTFIKIRFLDVIDILLVSYLLYEIYNLIKGTAAISIFIGIVSVFIVWRLVRVLEMEMLSEILGAFISVGFIALIVVFQPEIRKFLLLLGTPSFIRRRRRRFFFWKVNLGDEPLLDIDPIVKACHKMANLRLGALIVVAENNELEEYIDTGELIDARITEQMIESIFFKNSPLHDGALILLNNRIRAARCVLPVSKKDDLPAFIGLRHRAAVGITERSDAVAIVVSEQTGKIAYSKRGELQLDLSPGKLKNILETEFNP